MADPFDLQRLMRSAFEPSGWDRIARALHDARSGRRHPASDEQWERSKNRFRTTYRALLEGAEQVLSDSDITDLAEASQHAAQTP